MNSQSDRIIFQRKSEPKENAATLLVPQGWEVEGGIFRANFFTEQVSAQNIEAKVDLSIKKDSPGTVMLRIVPEIKYSDPRYQMSGFFQVGSSYMGLTVCPIMPPAQFLSQMMFPWAHPQACQAQMINAQPWEEYANKYRQESAKHGMPIQYDGAEVTFSYEELGVRYKEKACTIIENLGQLAMGQWSNKSTYYYRAPADEFEDWEPVLFLISRSWQFNPQWLIQEQANQQMLTGSFNQAVSADRQRGQKMLETQHYIQNTLNEMLDHQRITNEEIRNDSYLTLTSQEEYINPYTNLVDYGSNQYNYRWVTEAGDEF